MSKDTILRDLRFNPPSCEWCIKGMKEVGVGVGGVRIVCWDVKSASHVYLYALRKRKNRSSDQITKFTLTLPRDANTLYELARNIVDVADAIKSGEVKDAENE